jgi:hypothetical protein
MIYRQNVQKFLPEGVRVHSAWGQQCAVDTSPLINTAHTVGSVIAVRGGPSFKKRVPPHSFLPRSFFPFPRPSFRDLPPYTYIDYSPVDVEFLTSRVDTGFVSRIQMLKADRL